MNTLVVMGFLKLSIKEEEHIDKFIRHKNMSFQSVDKLPILKN